MDQCIDKNDLDWQIAHQGPSVFIKQKHTSNTLKNSYNFTAENCMIKRQNLLTTTGDLE